MIVTTLRSAQRGATLIVALIMLALISLMVATSFNLSTVNLQSVGNMQFRDEAIGAGTRAIETAFSLGTMPTGLQVGTASTAVSVPVDVDNNGVADYTASVTRTCLRTTPVVTTSGPGVASSVSLGFAAPLNDHIIIWDYDATINDGATGTAVRVRQGIRQRVTQIQCDTLCPPAAGTPCS